MSRPRLRIWFNPFIGNDAVPTDPNGAPSAKVNSETVEESKKALTFARENARIAKTVIRKRREPAIAVEYQIKRRYQALRRC
jgi:hypothetical protein